MSHEPSVRELLAPMTEHEAQLDAPAFQVDRARVLAAMARAGEPPRRAGLGYAVLATAAAVLLLTVGVRMWPHAPTPLGLAVLVTSNGVTHSEPLAESGDVQTSADSSARVATPEGLQLELHSETHLGLAEVQASVSRVKLLSGAVRCTVPHRAAAHPFEVVTPDVTVVDLGTVFTVGLEGPNHATRVSVEEGEVLVRDATGERNVKAPGTWLSAGAFPQALPSAVPVSPELAAPPPSTSTIASTGTPHFGAKPAPATLEQESALLRQGLAAERQGHAADAAAAFSQLLKKYPHSPLVPDARAALTRVEASPPQ